MWNEALKPQICLFPIMHLNGIPIHTASKTARHSTIPLHKATEETVLFGEMWGGKYS